MFFTYNLVLGAKYDVGRNVRYWHRAAVAALYRSNFN